MKHTATGGKPGLGSDPNGALTEILMMLQLTKWCKHAVRAPWTEANVHLSLSQRLLVFVKHLLNINLLRILYFLVVMIWAASYSTFF